MKDYSLYLKALNVCSAGDLDPSNINGYGKIETINDLLEQAFDCRLPKLSIKDARSISMITIYSPERILKAFN